MLKEQIHEVVSNDSLTYRRIEDQLVAIVREAISKVTLSDEEIKVALAEDMRRIETKYGGSNMVATNYKSRQAFVDEVNDNLCRAVAQAAISKVLAELEK